MTAPDRPTAADDDDARTALLTALRQDLDGWTVDALEDVLGPVAAAALGREQPVPALRATRGSREPAALLLRLLLLGVDVPRADVDRALPRLGTEGAQRLGLVAAAGSGREDAVRALVEVTPYRAHDAAGTVDWWIASDLGEVATGGALRADHVLGVGGASTTLAQVTLRSPRRRTLDIGTGCGIQALHAARHSDVVVATDVSTRALRFAALNAALNGDPASPLLDGPAPRLRLREGSLLQPVADDEPFDLVVSNPPFVITPLAAGAGVPRYEYREAGRAGDDLVRELVTTVGSVLAPGGVAQLLANWEHRAGEGDWRERVEDWLDASGLDGWVVQREVLDPAQYAETWLRDGGLTADRDRAAWEAGCTAWLEDFEQRGVEAVGFGMVLLRRPVTGVPTLRRVEEHVGPVRQPLGDHLAAALAAHDLLRCDDDALAALRLVVAPDVTEERHLVPGAPDPTLVLLRQGDGFGRVVQVGTALAGLVGVCDGELAVGQVVGALAALLEVPTDALRAELLPQVRGLVADGFLRPAGPA